MRKIAVICLGFLVVSCLSEEGAKPGTTSTFIRYYNGGNGDTAQALEETPDKGFIILANTKIQKAEADIPNYKIKLIKTDANGNPVWTKLFPSIDVKDVNYSASSIQLLSGGGYVIVGDDIQSDGTTKTLLLTVDDSGNAVHSASYGTSVKGKAVTVNSANNFLILSTAGDATMYLSEIGSSTFTPVDPNAPTVLYQAGSTTLANKLYLDRNNVGNGQSPTDKVLWAGAVTKNGLTGIRFIKTVPNNVNTDFDLLISQPGFSEIATDFCRFGYGYAVIGSTNQKAGSTTAGTDTDIMFKTITTEGFVMSTKSFPFGDGITPDGQNDLGTSISSTQDGGLILLASVNSAAIKGNGDTDYYLIRINAFGDKIWGISFGSRYKDDGVAVRQSSDGGFVVLGTTTQGGLKIITLSKTDGTGKIQ